MYDSEPMLYHAKAVDGTCMCMSACIEKAKTGKRKLCAGKLKELLNEDPIFPAHADTTIYVLRSAPQ
jgi:hypothetical protein